MDRRADNEPSMSPPVLDTRADDDPHVVAAQVSEEYTSHVVPLTARLGRAKIAGSWWLNASAMVFVFYGALSADIAGTRQAIAGLVLATVTMAVLSPIFVRAAARTGLSSALISRRIFGLRGANLTVGLIAIGSTYYTVLEGSIMADALQQWFGVMDIRFWYGVVVVVTVPIAFGGMQTWLSKVSAAFLPVYIVGLVLAVGVAAMRSDGSGDWLDYAGSGVETALPGWLVVYAMYMGIWLLLIDQIDFARFARPEDSTFHSWFSFGALFYVLTYLVNGLIGIYVVRTVATDVPPSEAGIVVALLDTIGLLGLVAIVVSQLRINTMNIYIASLNTSRLWNEFFSAQLGRRIAVLLVGVVAFLLMLTDVFRYITLALSWMGIIFVAWVGIYIAQVAVERIRNVSTVEFRPGRVPRYGPGLVSWIVAAGIGILLIEATTLPDAVSTLAPIATFLVSIGVHAAVMLFRRPWQGHDADPVRDEVRDLWATWVRCGLCHRYYVAAEVDLLHSGRTPACLACAAVN